jgi:PIN domain nuclease of toxin-antitoxin system
MPKRAHDLIIDPANEIWGSVIAIWEVAIKHARRAREGRQAIVSGSIPRDHLADAGLPLLPVTAEHAAMLDELPAIHADPFDRLLIAQAKVEPMRLLTVDRTLEAYGDAVLLV